MATDRSEERAAMLADQLAARGIEDRRVLAAMGAVPREAFVPAERAHEAYGDHAVSLAAGQTISQPWIVAAICQALALRPVDRVLEIGTGSGYSTAVISRLGGEVISIERLPELDDLARRNLAAAGEPTVEVICADGSVGLPDRGPFDAIAVHAAIPTEPQLLLAQLAPCGRLVAPIAIAPGSGGEAGEYLVRWQRPLSRQAPDDGEDAELEQPEGRSYARETIASCRFVPLIGAAGYPDPRGEGP
jgi:protein-L-isoaspartate(D-aspartate) O-methyltransferase